MSWESNLLGSKRMTMQNLFSIWISHGALNFKTTRSFTSFPPSPPPPTAVSNNIFPSKYRSQGTHQWLSVISHYFSRQQVKILLRSLLWECHYIQRVSELTNISEIFIASFWSVTIFWNLMIKHEHKKTWPLIHVTYSAFLCLFSHVNFHIISWFASFCCSPGCISCLK